MCTNQATCTLYMENVYSTLAKAKRNPPYQPVQDKQQTKEQGTRRPALKIEDGVFWRTGLCQSN